MGSSIKIIITATVAIAIGLLAGYFIFGNNQNANVPAEIHKHESGAIPSSSETDVWTCSMHPQIRQNEAGDCPICGMDLIPLAENTSDNPLVLEMTNEAVKLANVQTSVIGEGDRETANTMRLSGKIQPDERLASSQVAHVPGRIEKLYVSFTGEQVSKGQKIATLYSPELITAQRELLEALKLKDLNPDLAKAARNKLRYWKIDESIIQEIEQEGKIRENFTVYADETGVVTDKKVTVGDYVQQGEPMFKLVSLNRVWALFDAYEEDLPNISVGDIIAFTTPSLAGRSFQAEVSFIDPFIDPVTRVASVRTEVANRGRLLKPEMLIYGLIRNSNSSSGQIQVPKSAVLWTGKRSVVYVKVPDTAIPSFEFREVNIGEAMGEYYEVLSGLTAGEEVVSNGSFTIDAAAQLNNQASMMNRDIEVKNAPPAKGLPDYSESTPSSFKEQLSALVSTYLLLKDALVATNSKSAIKAADQLLNALDEVEMSQLEGKAHIYWMDQERAIKTHTADIASSDDIKEQRRQFDFLSQAFIKAVKVFGTGASTLYIQHCPMVNNDEGADWISDEKSIRNPYFGDEMLSCGLVKTTINASFENRESRTTHKH